MAKQKDLYYQLVAQNFLRNISLDGSHQDTALKIFNEKGLQSNAGATVGPTSATHLLNNEISNDRRHSHGKRSSISRQKRKTPDPRSPQHHRSSVAAKTSGARRNFRGRLWSSGAGSESQEAAAAAIFSSGAAGGIFSKISQKLVGGGGNPYDSHHHHKALLRPQISAVAAAAAAVSDENLSQSASVLSSKGGGELVRFQYAAVLRDTANALAVGGGRVVMCDNRTPLLVYSIVPYRPGGATIADKDALVADARSAISAEDLGLRPFNLRSDEEISYSPLLVPSKSAASLSTTTGSVSLDMSMQNFPASVVVSSTPGGQQQQQQNLHSVSTVDILNTSTVSCSESESANILLNKSFVQYDANMLDNASEFGAGKHKATLTFTSFISTIIDYVHPSDLKKEVNEKFKKRFPELKLSYSKYRSLKLEMKDIAANVNMDMLTLAHAFVYFDKVVLKAIINKNNRKYLAGVGLLLAAKMNDVKGGDLRILIQKIEETFRITRKDLLQYELPTAVALEFTLHVPLNDLSSQYQKLLQAS